MAIIVAGGLIAAAIFLGGRTDTVSTTEPQNETAAALLPTAKPSALTLRAVDETRDHIRGNPEADIVFVEFSDTECPFCKRFHFTMQEVMNEYGKSGKVAWVYRHFPIPALQGHENAPKQAEATECAAELGGNVAFWKVIDRMFEEVPLQGTLDMSLLPQFAGEAGLDSAQFTSCLESGRMQAEIQRDLDDGSTAGVSGTPYSTLVLRREVSEEERKALLTLMEPFRDSQGELLISFSTDRLRIGVSGALPADVLKNIVEILLK